jgi:hypothetical protein
MAGGRVVRIRVDNAGIDSTIYRIPSGSGGDATVTERGGQAPFNETVPMEWSVYGLGVVGVSWLNSEQEEGPVYTRTVGKKRSPLTDHLGSDQATTPSTSRGRAPTLALPATRPC